MGFFFTLVYITTTYIGPPILYGDMAQYHIELAIALVTLLFSIPSMQDSQLLEIPQTYGIIGLALAVGASVIFAGGWIGGAPAVVLNFLPDAMVFFFVAVNCKKKIHLQILIASLVLISFWTIFRGYAAMTAGYAENPYVITMKNSTGEVFYRIRGVTFLNDPNDFAQFMVGLIPCVFFFWKKGASFRNTVVVYVPVAILLMGMFLTHSRGGMIAMMAAVMIAGRRKFGVVRSFITAGVVFVALTVVGWSGGRAVSVESGADRMDAWAAGLMMIRTHPLFGVGYKRFRDFHPLTAHNTVIVCAAELGLIGLFWWMVLVVPTIRDAWVGSEPSPNDEESMTGLAVASRPMVAKAGSPYLAMMRVAGMEPSQKAGAQIPRNAALAGGSSLGITAPSIAPVERTPARTPYNFMDPLNDVEEIPSAEIHRMLSLLLVSLAGFFAAGWFLSRAYTMTLFLNTGMVAAVYRMARDRNIAPPSLEFARVAKLAVIASVVGVIVVWITLRLDHLMPH